MRRNSWRPTRLISGIAFNRGRLQKGIHGHSACLCGHSVLFATAVDIINTLAVAQATGALKREINRYLKPRVLIIDELGYLPIDKHGADLLFQIIRRRYERGPILITSNRAYKS